MCHVLGYTLEELRAGGVRLCLAGIEPYTEKDARQYMEQARGGESLNVEMLGRRKDGTQFWMEVALSCARMHDQERILATVRDITDRKDLEYSLIRTERLAAVGTLAAGIAHEFNNINVSAQGFCELALKEDDVPEPARLCMERVHKSIQRSSNIIKRLLSFSRTPNRDREPGDLVQAADDTLALLEPELRKSGVQVIRVVSDLPNVVMPTELLAQIALNLVINASHATLGQPDRRVEVEIAERDGQGALTVRDNGCGIAPDDLPKLFTPFFSRKGEHAPGTGQARVRGTGLGLSVSQTLVAEYDGEISVESKPGEGSVFTVQIPFARDDASGKQR